MQIAGSKCGVCNDNIVFSSDGKYCERCGTVFHIRCEPRDRCAVCGEPFKEFEKAPADLTRASFLPRAMRPTRINGAVFVLMGLLAFIFMWIAGCFAEGH
jgi:hypothetical protein